MCISVVLLRLEHFPESSGTESDPNQRSPIRAVRRWDEALALMLTSAVLSFLLGICTRLEGPLWLTVLFAVLTLLPGVLLYTRQVRVLWSTHKLYLF